ncbi:MAG: hypothetical protein RIF33_02215 [Cyclobacteriaceae bacterium]
MAGHCKSGLLGLYLLFLLVGHYGHTQSSEEFALMKDSALQLWSSGEHEQAIALLEKNQGKYTRNEELHAMLYYRGLLNLEINSFDASAEAFKKGFERQFFFSLWPTHVEMLRAHPEGAEIISLNEELRERYVSSASVKTKVLLPEDYLDTKSYPLLYFLHGNNSSLDNLITEWKDIQLDREAIVVLAQSPYARSNYGFDWTESPLCYAAFETLHLEIIQSYSVDSTQIILSGFSNGARFGISRFLEQNIKVSGFLGFSPSKVQDLFQDNLPLGRGAIITGEGDYLLDEQKSFAQYLKQREFPLHFDLLVDVGHEYPSDFNLALNDCLNFLLEK